MKKRNFTDEEIAYVLRQAETGRPVTEICREAGISQQTSYRWKRKFEGMDIAELRRLKQLKRENNPPQTTGRRPHARQAYASRGSPEKGLKPAQKRHLVTFLMVGFQVSQRRACELAGLARSTMRYEAVEKNDDALQIRLRELASVYVRYGMPRLYVLLRREGWIVNHKRVYQLYKEEGLELRTKKRKKQVSQPRGVQAPAEAPRERWSMDFISDTLACGRRFRVLTLVDHFSRVSPAIEVDHSLTGQRVA